MSNFIKYYRKKDSESKEATHQAIFIDLGRGYKDNNILFGEIGQETKRNFLGCESTFDDFIEENNFEEIKMTNNNHLIGKKFKSIQTGLFGEIGSVDGNIAYFKPDKNSPFSLCIDLLYLWEELPDQEDDKKQVGTEKKTQEEIRDFFSKNSIDQAIFESKAALNNFNVNCSRSVGELKYKLQNVLNELNFGNCQVCNNPINNFNSLKKFGNYVCSFECRDGIKKFYNNEEVKKVKDEKPTIKREWFNIYDPARIEKDAREPLIVAFDKGKEGGDKTVYTVRERNKILYCGEENPFPENKPKSIWKPVNELPKYNCKVFIKAETGIIFEAEFWWGQQKFVLPREENREVSCLIKEFCTLTDYINHQAELEKRIKRLEQKEK